MHIVCTRRHRPRHPGRSAGPGARDIARPGARPGDSVKPGENAVLRLGLSAALAAAGVANG